MDSGFREIYPDGKEFAVDFAFQREPAVKAVVLLVGVVTLATQMAMVSTHAAPPQPSICQDEFAAMADFEYAEQDVLASFDQLNADDLARASADLPGQVLPQGSVLPVASQIDLEVPSPDRIAEYLVEAVVQVESGGDPSKIGNAGERGIMQIKRTTWIHTTKRLFGHVVHFDRAFDPTLNRRVGRAYLAEMSVFLRQYRPLWRSDERALLLACYNAGPARVLEAHFDIGQLPASTKSYVERASTLHDYYLDFDGTKLRPVQVVEFQQRDGSVPGSRS
jgi:hypothetical protein